MSGGDLGSTDLVSENGTYTDRSSPITQVPLILAKPVRASTTRNDNDREATLMSDESDDIKTAASRLTDAMSGLLRAVDAVADEGVAARDIPEELPEQLERLAERLNAARGFGG
jgi:hypothetical protein